MSIRINRLPAGLRADLPHLPIHMRGLLVDHRGFPVPWFVQWMENGKPARYGIGEPDFRVMDTQKFIRCRQGLEVCWICGNRLGVHKIFTIGPMCSINRIISEPPSHRVCAEFAVKACPFLSKPRMRRNEKDLPAGEVAGFHIDRNPGISCLWETNEYRWFRTVHGGSGYLCSLGEPRQTEWYTEGRLASRAEVLESIESGYPFLMNMAKKEGNESIRDLERKKAQVLKLLPG